MTFTKDDIRAFKLSKVLHDRGLSIVQNYITNQIKIYQNISHRILLQLQDDYKNTTHLN